jgi:hypothetical protein
MLKGADYAATSLCIHVVLALFLSHLNLRFSLRTPQGSIEKNPLPLKVSHLRLKLLR